MVNNTPHTMPADSQTFNDELNTVKSRYLDDLHLSLERIEMLEAVINDTAQAINEVRNYLNAELIKPINTRLGIGQLLAMDFVATLKSDIKKMESTQ